MSKSSIYESKWTNLVFENKNQEYGAYQLRQENSKTSITALFMGLLLLAALGSISMLISKLSPKEIVEQGPVLPPSTPVHLNPDLVVPQPPAPPAPPVQQNSAPASATDLSQLTNPVIVPTAQAVDNIATNVENVAAVDNAVPGNGTITNAIPSTGGNGTEIAPSTGNTNDPVNTAILDKMPVFPGGMSNFYNYVGNNFRRPELDMEKTLRVYVSFVIERDGSITDIVVKNDPGYGMGKEAIRVLKALKQNGSREY